MFPRMELKCLEGMPSGWRSCAWILSLPHSLINQQDTRINNSKTSPKAINPKGWRKLQLGESNYQKSQGESEKPARPIFH